MSGIRTQAITANRLITSDRIVERPLIFFEEGRIVQITTRDERAAPAGTLEFSGTLAPGFLDIHVHGAGGHDLMEPGRSNVQHVARSLAKFGTTSFLATTVTAPMDHTLRALEQIADLIEQTPEGDAARIAGVHIEGPFLSHSKRGVHPAGDLQPPDVRLFDRMFAAARGNIRLMTIAPELPGALHLIAHAAAKGVRISLGHSNALAVDARAGLTAARAAGASAQNPHASATHTFNAMRALDHREPGILGVVLDDSDLYAELICDGIHVLPELVRLWWRCKGVERGILITDGLAAAGMPDGMYKLGDMDVEVRNGAGYHGDTLAGSTLTMDRALQNFLAYTGASLPEALRLTTVNPAHMLGIAASAGKLEVGTDANLNVLTDTGERKATILRGVLL